MATYVFGYGNSAEFVFANLVDREEVYDVKIIRAFSKHPIIARAARWLVRGKISVSKSFFSELIGINVLKRTSINRDLPMCRPRSNKGG
jgi:hypothetical protein